MEKSRGKLVVYAILVMILLLSLIKIFMSGVGYFIRLELAGFLFLVLLSLLGFAGYSKRWGERLLFFVFLLYLVNLLLLWYFHDALYFVLLLVALVGFFMSLPKNEGYPQMHPVKNPVEKEEEAHSVVFDPVEQKVEQTEKVIVQHTPGKYVASKSSNVYHEPKCDWAKKVKEDRRTWFADKKEAQGQGYRKHACVE
jgi:hypothetical protein